MKVVFFHRRRWPNANFSIETIFENLRADLDGKIESTVVICPHHSKGFFRRLINAIHASRRQGPVNHVTGDVNFLAIGMSHKRTILTHHDASFLIRTKGVKHQILKLVWLQLPVWRSRFVTTVSNATREDLLSRVRCGPEKVIVIPNAISDDFAAFPKSELCDPPRILQVGTAPNKNIERLAEALQGLNCRLRIVGKLSNSQRGALNQFRIQYDNVFNLTDQNVREEYRRADVVSFISTIEGFGMPILEAQATGRSVVTSNCSSMPETAGDGAILVDPFDIASIRVGFVQVLKDSDLRNRLIRAGFENVKRFDRKRIAQQYYRLYETVVAGTSSR